MDNFVQFYICFPVNFFTQLAFCALANTSLLSLGRFELDEFSKMYCLRRTRFRGRDKQ